MDSDKINLELTRDEALVLFEWVSRFNQSNDATFDDRSEQRVLWNLQALLEATLAEPFEPTYDELLARARAIVRDPAD